jgi:histidinol phosphate phosphatase HisJ family
MFLADYHMHSSASFDADDTMQDMALAAHGRGMQEICFTDHIDMDDIYGVYSESHWDKWPTILEQYDEAQRICPAGFEIKLGIELGSIQHYPNIAAQRAAHAELDFVIGSIHNNRDNWDFYDMEYTSEEQCMSLLSAYMDEHIELSRCDSFDVVAHIGYTRRYMMAFGYNIAVNTLMFGDELRTVFKNLIERGKGIEINCSGFRNADLAGAIPSLDVVKLYREMGGEIITVGSDAHRVGEAGAYIADGLEILREAGFKYVTVFNKRKPIYKKI